MILRWPRRLRQVASNFSEGGLLAVWVGLTTEPPPAGDTVTTEPAYFRRTVTTAAASIRRSVTTGSASVRRTVTTANGER